jgi:hypothetical protein
MMVTAFPIEQAAEAHRAIEVEERRAKSYYP